MAKYLAQGTTSITEVNGLAVSTGATDAGKIPQLDSSGRFDTSMLPVGVGPDTKTILASEALTAGDFVNVVNNAGTPNARKADATNGRPAHGFVLAAVANAANATVYFEGRNTAVTGLTAGLPRFLAATGATQAAVPTTAGHIAQQVGIAVSATEIDFESHLTVTIA